MPINRKWIEQTSLDLADRLVHQARQRALREPGVSQRMKIAMSDALDETQRGVWIEALTSEIETWLGGVVVPTARTKAATALRREQRARAREGQ